ncbi:MAG: PepSY-associated TM helix domain-containing protein [Bacteroidota bacterium]
MDENNIDKKRRIYNVFFNTHTVGGIAISIGLFVIFLAGAYSLFVREINRWQEGVKKQEYTTDIDFERVIDSLAQEAYQLEGRTIDISLREDTQNYIRVRSEALSVDKDTAKIFSQKDSLARTTIYMEINPETYQIEERERNHENTQLGTFLFHLHYFGQIPIIGIRIAGLVSLFFAFTMLTGIIIHWNKIISNFFTFRLKTSIKNLWTDAHTALGVIGFPFQFMYAITGAFYGLILLLYIPILAVVFDGDQEKLVALLQPKIEAGKDTITTSYNDTSINGLVKGALSRLNHSEVEFMSVLITNYGKQEAELVFTAQMNSQKHFMNNVVTTFQLSDGTVLSHKPMDENSYFELSTSTIFKLHFATFGGYLIKAVYFVLSLLTCFVIISGVMIWLVAREKKTYAHKAKFNRNIGAIFIGACMGLYPAIALFFCLVKILPESFSLASNIFFLFWLAFTIYAFFIKRPFKINKHALLVAGVFGLLIPVFNGLESGLWFWKSLGMGYKDSFFVDVSWLVISVITLWAAWKAKPVDKRLGEKGKVEGLVGVSDKEITGQPVFNLTSTSNK